MTIERERASVGSTAAEVDLHAVFSALPRPAAVFAADAPRFTLVAASDALLALAGRTRESMIGRPLGEVFPDGMPDAARERGLGILRQSLEAAAQTGLPQRRARERYDLRGPDGAWESRYWDVLVTPVRGADGAVRWVLYQPEDVTARVRGEQAGARAEAALHETEAVAARQLAQLEAIYRHAPVGLAVLDRELRFRHVNDFLVAINGLPAEAHIGRTVREVLPDIADAVEAIARRVLDTGEPVRDLPLSGETPAQPGEVRHWVEQWYPLRDPAGAIVGINVVVDDVTERRRAEAALRESEGRFRTMADLVPDLLWQSAPDGTTDWYNARWYEYTGQPPERSAGWGWTEAIHPEDRAAAAADYARAAATGEPLALEARLRAADGSFRWFVVRVEPQRDDAGRIARWLGAASDVHAQRLALEEVERRVAERTAELARAEAGRDELRRELASAEEAERRRLARELHDQLGQHLTALALGLADARRLLRAGASADERLGQLEELPGAMTRDARYLALELRPPELDDVGLDSALETYLEQWSRRFAVETEIAITGLGADRPLPADVGTAVYRIVQEALTNIAKHAGATQVTVLLERQDGFARLIVEDDGRGFDPEEAVVRARATRRLGLASMRERAALVGGTLEVESSPGRGTTLYVRLPLERRART